VSSIAPVTNSPAVAAAWYMRVGPRPPASVQCASEPRGAHVRGAYTCHRQCLQVPQPSELRTEAVRQGPVVVTEGH
jgi:hypothetical protein